MSFDIIIMDVMIPSLDGLEVTRRLRHANIQTPILLLTSRDAPEEIVRGLDAGADDYLTKPFSFDVLLALLRVRTRGASAPGMSSDLPISRSTWAVVRRAVAETVVPCRSLLGLLPF